ncbi:unnamed protein product [Candidula unifasciata]|uniref:Uncharacterized protein n=1 Tax=Candidula unifasciata TaxID=100452 RepID=A0A8S3ZPX7_9EUPU|nr:unnamed protein product [Candidula unifasciata]
MLQLIIMAACLIFMQGLLTTEAHAVGGCVDQLTASLANETENCVATTDYIKCLFLETSLYKTTDKAVLSQYKTQIKAGLAEKGIHCDIDVMAIVDELLENDRKGIAHTTSRPKGYKNSKTIGDCIDTFEAEATSELMCDRMTPYLKCLILVTSAKKPSNYTDEDIRILVQRILNNLHKTYAQCQMNISALIREVRHEEGIEDGSVSHQGSGENGADIVVESLSFVTVLILSFASVFLVY